MNHLQYDIVPYAAFEPYYTKAEKLFRVHGVRESDLTEPPASGLYLSERRWGTMKMHVSGAKHERSTYEVL